MRFILRVLNAYKLHACDTYRKTLYTSYLKTFQCCLAVLMNILLLVIYDLLNSMSQIVIKKQFSHKHKKNSKLMKPQFR